MSARVSMVLTARTNCSVVGAACTAPAPARPSTAAIPVAARARIVVRILIDQISFVVAYLGYVRCVAKTSAADSRPLRFSRPLGADLQLGVDIDDEIIHRPDTGYRDSHLAERRAADDLHLGHASQSSSTGLRVSSISTSNVPALARPLMLEVAADSPPDPA